MISTMSIISVTVVAGIKSVGDVSVCRAFGIRGRRIQNEVWFRVRAREEFWDSREASRIIITLHIVERRKRVGTTRIAQMTVGR
jgi:hypothetical protein